MGEAGQNVLVLRGRFHRSRRRGTPPPPFDTMIKAQTLDAPPSPSSLARLTRQSSRRRHSLSEYNGLSSNRLLAPPLSLTAPPHGGPAGDPILLRLPPQAIAYEIRWAEGPLGITLHRQGTATAVKSTTNLMAAPGDTLLAINGASTAEMDYFDVMLAVRRLPKPATLTFLRDPSVAAAAGPLPNVVEENDTALTLQDDGKDQHGTTRHKLIESDDMYDLLANLMRDHDGFGNDTVHTNTTIMTSTTSTYMAYCSCRSCSNQGSSAATCTTVDCLTATAIDRHNIDAFDSLGDENDDVRHTLTPAASVEIDALPAFHTPQHRFAHANAVSVDIDAASGSSRQRPRHTPLTSNISVNLDSGTNNTPAMTHDAKLTLLNRARGQEAAGAGRDTAPTSQLGSVDESEDTMSSVSRDADAWSIPRHRRHLRLHDAATMTSTPMTQHAETMTSAPSPDDEPKTTNAVATPDVSTVPPGVVYMGPATAATPPALFDPAQVMLPPGYMYHPYGIPVVAAPPLAVA
ncbi:hypothetical protein As57867_018935, partial [Aphanomyces stellatus]